MAKVALCIVATGKYKEFLPDLIQSADKYFLNGHIVHYHKFTDSGINRKTNPILPSSRVRFTHSIEHEPWPNMTLHRWHIMRSVDLSDYDYVYYIDADMRFVAPVGSEIFGKMVAVQHPGYYRGGGTWETRKESHAFVPAPLRSHYVAGGFQGGSMYWQYCEQLKLWTDEDLAKGITAVWNDESYWNRLYSDHRSSLFTLLPPSYCMVEEEHKRKAWGINHFEPKIIALAKEHKQFQK